MNRRNFLSLFSAGVAGIALEQAIPLGRVWSFPKKIVITGPLEVKVPEMFMGVDWGFGYSDLITMREMWRRSPSGEIWVRRETLKADGSYEELHGWELDAYGSNPLVLYGNNPLVVTPAVPPERRRL